MPGLDNARMPSGLIMQWSGTLATIPTGFFLCDGTNGTPNLLSKFIRSVPNACTNPGTTGGSDTHVIITGEMPVHNHGVSDDSHVHSWGSGGNRSGFNGTTGNTVSGSGTVAGITVGNAGSNTAHENRPAFFEVAFIMRK